MAIVQHRSGGTHIDGNAKSQIFRLHLQRTKPGSSSAQTHGGDHSGRAARDAPGLLRDANRCSCCSKILLILKAAHLEEGRLYETHQVLHASFCCGAIRPAQLHSRSPAPRWRRRRPDSIPSPRRFSATAGPLSSADRTRNAAELHPSWPDARPRFAPNSPPPHPSPRLTHMKREYFRREAKKWIRLAGAIDELYFDLSKIMLAEFSGQTSKRTSGLASFGRSEATSAYRAVLPPS